MKKITTKKSIHVAMPYDVFYDWKNKNNLSEGDYTERILSLIRFDTILNEEEKERRDIERELKECEESIFEFQSRAAVLHQRLQMITKKEMEEESLAQEQKRDLQRRQVDLMKEKVVMDAIGEPIF